MTARKEDGRRIHADGYLLVWAPKHPRATNRYVLEHVLVVELVLGKSLPSTATIHHVNEKKDDNRNANLLVLQNQTEHVELHSRLVVLRAGGNPWTQRMCCYCHLPKDVADFYPARDRKVSSACRECSRTRSRERQRLKRAAA